MVASERHYRFWHWGSGKDNVRDGKLSIAGVLTISGIEYGTWFPSWLQIGVCFIRYYCVVMDMYLYAGVLLY